MSWDCWLNRIGRGGLAVVVLMAVIMWGPTEDRASWRRRGQYSFEPWRTVRYFGLAAWGPAPPAPKRLSARLLRGIKKGDAVASPSKVVEVEERMFAAQQRLAANSELRPHPR